MVPFKEVGVPQWRKRYNVLELHPILATKSILVRKEVLAFPTDSLVADCGGVLGLFLGFNFLLVWEWMLNGFFVVVNRFNKIK